MLAPNESLRLPLKSIQLVDATLEAASSAQVQGDREKAEQDEDGDDRNERQPRAAFGAKREDDRTGQEDRETRPEPGAAMKVALALERGAIELHRRLVARCAQVRLALAPFDQIGLRADVRRSDEREDGPE